MKVLKIIIGLLLIGNITVMTSCNKDDSLLLTCTCYSPTIEFFVYVLDKDSISILNDSVQRSMYMDNISLKYYNVEYTCNQPISEYSKWKGIILARDYDSKFYCFRIGGWDSKKTYKNETVTLNWGDGNSDEFSFSNIHKCTNGKEERELCYYLNGKKLNSNHVFIIKDNLPMIE